MPYHQTTLTLPAYARGIHIITPLIEDAIEALIPHSSGAGLVHLFLQHTSASLAINGRLGMWQGIYLCEHRNQISQRKLVITVNT